MVLWVIGYFAIAVFWGAWVGTFAHTRKLSTVEFVAILLFPHFLAMYRVLPEVLK